MGLGKIFSAIGRGLKSPTALKAAVTVLPHLPIPGAAWAAVLLRVAQAEREFPAGSGKAQKRPWVEHQAAKDLRELGYDREGLEALVELAVLNLKGLVSISDGREDESTSEIEEPEVEEPEVEETKKPRARKPKEEE